MKKFVSLLIMVILLIGTFPGVTQAATAKNSEIQSLVKKYNLKQVSKAPRGITPKKFSSVKEADKFLQQAKSMSTKKSAAPRLFAVPSASSAKVMYPNRFTRIFSVFSVMLYKNLMVAYTLGYNGKGQKVFVELQDVNSYITGVTLFSKWTQTGYDYYLSTDRKALYAKAYATMDIYFFLKDVLQVFTVNMEVSNTFTNP
jgi:hypothetical protein